MKGRAIVTEQQRARFEELRDKYCVLLAPITQQEMDELLELLGLLEPEEVGSVVGLVSEVEA